jgi:hypothetical protein
LSLPPYLEWGILLILVVRLVPILLSVLFPPHLLVHNLSGAEAEEVQRPESRVRVRGSGFRLKYKRGYED